MAVLLDAFQEAVGSIKPWLRANTAEPLPPNWVICDGSTISDPGSPFDTKAIPDMRDKFVRGHPTLTNANFAADAAYEAGGTIPAGGTDTNDTTHAHAAGAHTHGVGSHAHTVGSDGTHNHGVSNHVHSTPLHTHPIPSEASHTHSFTTGTANQSGVPATGGSYNGGPFFHNHLGTTAGGGSHSHGGATNSGGAGNTSSNGPGSTSSGGSHSHGGATGAAGGTTDPGVGNTGNAGSVLDNTPAHLALLIIIKIK